MIRARIIISGFVQGVGFRYFIKQKADELGLTGWVRNTEDGNVEALFQGEDEKVQEAVAACKEGPPFAKVEDVETEQEEAKGDLDSFEIRYY